MAYADQTMSTRKAVSIGIVVLLHVALGYAFITGLAINVIKKAAKDLNVVDVKEAPPPPPKPPPPPPPDQKVTPPPIVAPPPIVRTNTLPPPIVAPPAPPVPSPPAPIITPAAPPAPAPPVVSKAAGAKGDPAQWVTSDDYPPGALRENKEGVSRIAWEINEQGRIENCHTVQSSGTPELDDAACRVLTRRGKYSPALDTSGRPMRSSSSRSIRWQVPKD